MFGFSKLWAAVSRLAASVNQTADLFDEANARLRERLAMDEPEEVKALPAPENGRLEKYARQARSK